MEAETLSIQPAENPAISLLNTEVLGNANEVKTDDVIVVDSENNGKSIVADGVTKDEPSVAVVPEPVVPDVTKFSYDVQHGYRIFCELLSDQYKAVTYPFREPVDVEGLGLWDYYQRIETPMSFRQIDVKFKSYLYQSITEIISDLRLILENCYRYNGSDHWISKLAQKLENILDQKLALLNRSLREKVSLQATMAFRNNKSLVIPDADESGGRRRRSGRSGYSNGRSGEQTSRLVSHLILKEEETQKELRRQKEKEKREANEALMQELAEWEKEVLVRDLLKELHSMWEVPSIGSFLWLFQEPLNLPELNYTEFENGLLLPNKSRLMAWIFTCLLVTPSQRKSVQKKPPMRFSIWEKKLKERVDMWYITREAEEFQLVPHTTGPDQEFFEILGETNPLEKKSYLDLSLHQRVLILKSLCDECMDYDYQFRDYLGNADSTPFREMILGNDGLSHSYLYFPIFDATDVRIYKQAALPSSAEWYRRWKANKSSGYVKQARINQSRSRKPSSSRKSKSWSASTSIQDGFELVCHDVDSLRELCEKFADHTTTPSGKKRRGRPPRKHCEKLLHQELLELLEGLSASEAKYNRARTKGMLNLMRDWKKVEDPQESDEESIAPTEDQVEENDIEAAKACPALKEHPTTVKDIATNPRSSSQTEMDDPTLPSPMAVAKSCDVTTHGGDDGTRVTKKRHRTPKRMYDDTYTYSPPPSLAKASNPKADHILRNVVTMVSQNPDQVISDKKPADEISNKPISDTPENKVSQIFTDNDVSEKLVLDNTTNTRSADMGTSEKSDRVIVPGDPCPEGSKPADNLANVNHGISDKVPITRKDPDLEVAMEANVTTLETKPVLCQIAGFADEAAVVKAKVGSSVSTNDETGHDRIIVDNKDGCVTEGSSVDDNVANSKDMIDKRGIRDVDDCLGTKRDNCSSIDATEPGNIMDTSDSQSNASTPVHQNGALAIRNGGHEPAQKRHCSADTRMAVETNQSAPLDTSHQLPLLKKKSENVVESSHQSSVIKTLQEENAKSHAVVILEASHQSLEVKTT